MNEAAEIMRVGRALMSALQPLTGDRAFGQVRLRALPGETVRIPRFTYFTPMLSGDQHPGWYFKTAPGPNADDSWTVDDTGTALVDVYSNLGGVRFNVPSGTRFVPDVPFEGLDVGGVNYPRAEEDFEGGSDAEAFGSVRDMGFYETFDGPALTTDLTRSPIRHFPAVLLAFDTLEPADGTVISQLQQQSVSAGGTTRMFKIGYSISIIVSRTEGDQHRRHEGLLIADQLVHTLVEINASPDGEIISNPGGVQIRQLIREAGDQSVYQKFYVYTLFVSAMVSITRTDRRVYKPWLTARMDINRRHDDEAASVAQRGDLPVVEDMIIDMTPNQLDLAVDGAFTRASTATLFRFGQSQLFLLQFGVGARRVNAQDPSLGVFMEPAITNPLGNAAEDLTLWTPSAGATIGPASLENPYGTPGEAHTIAFTAAAERNISLAAQPATLGEPIVMSVFARAISPQGRTKFRLGVFDGISEIASGDFEADSTWRRYRWKVIPQSNLVTLRIRNQSDLKAHSLAVWGVAFNDDARWGPEYTFVAKAKDALTFRPYVQQSPAQELDTPLQALLGKWSLRWSNDDTPPALLGLGDPTAIKLMSVGDGATELFTLELYGVPASGGAALVARTRGDGVVVNLSGLRWSLGKQIEFGVDAQGSLTLKGTDSHDGTYQFPAYDQDANLSDDFLVIGGSSTGAHAPTPGWFAVVVGA